MKPAPPVISMFFIMTKIGKKKAPRGEPLNKMYTVHLLLCLDSGLGSGQTCYGNPERRAGNVGKSHFIAEFDRLRIASVFPAYAEFDFRICGTASGNRSFNQFSHRFFINVLERIKGQDFFMDVFAHE